MSIIKVKTKDQKLLITQAPLISSGNVNADTIEFDFDPTWDEYTERYAVFHNDKYGSMQVQLNNDRCEVLSAVLEEEGIFYFGVWGRHRNLDSVKTSELEAYTVVKGTPTDGWSITTWDEYWAHFTSIAYMFKNNKSIIHNPPVFPTINCKDFTQAFAGSEVVDVTVDVSEATSISGMFADCINLKNITLLGEPDITLANNAFRFCRVLENINGVLDFTHIQDYFREALHACDCLKEVRLKENSLSHGLTLNMDTNLSRESVLSILKACRQISEPEDILFSNAVYSEEIQPQIMEAVGKGWTIAFQYGPTFNP